MIIICSIISIFPNKKWILWKGGIEQTNSWMSKVTFMFLANTNLTILMLLSNHHTMTTGFDSQPWPICRYECQVDSSLQTLQRFQRKLDVRHFLGRIVWEKIVNMLKLKHKDLYDYISSATLKSFWMFLSQVNLISFIQANRYFVLAALAVKSW